MVNRILFVALYLIRNFLQSCFYYIHFPMPFILFSIYNLLSSESILYFSFYFIAVLFFLLYVALVSLKGFLLGTFTLLLQLLSRKISAISFLETCLVFFPLLLFFLQLQFAIFFFRKFQCCFSYCSNFLFSKLSFNVTLPFLDIFSLIKCRFLCKIKFLWTWLKNWSLNRNLYYSSNTIMHTRKNTLNIFACRAILQIHLHTFAIFA